MLRSLDPSSSPLSNTCLRHLRCPCFRLLAFCNIGPESDNFLGLAVSFPQEARLVLYPKVVAVLGSKPVLLHQLALAHQERRFLDSGFLVIGMQTFDPPVRGQRFLDFVTKDSFNAVTDPLVGKTFRCDRKLINDGWNGIQNMARPLSDLTTSEINSTPGCSSGAKR